MNRNDAGGESTVFRFGCRFRVCDASASLFAPIPVYKAMKASKTTPIPGFYARLGRATTRQPSKLILVYGRLHVQKKEVLNTKLPDMQMVVPLK